MNEGSYLKRPWGMGERESEAVCDDSGKGLVIHRSNPIRDRQFSREALEHIIDVHNASLGNNTEAIAELLSLAYRAVNALDCSQSPKSCLRCDLRDAIKKVVKQ